MGSGASAPLSTSVGLGSPQKLKNPDAAATAFTSLKAEIQKPLDANDLCTPRGSTNAAQAREEVQRLRHLIFKGKRRVDHAVADENSSDNGNATNMLLYGSETPDASAGEDDRVHHIDDFEERRTRKKNMNKKLRKMKMAMKNPVHHVMEMMNATHVLMNTVNMARGNVGGGASMKEEEEEEKQRRIKKEEEDEKEKQQTEKWISHNYTDRDVAILVSDLRGFTSTTRRYGIVHFASIIVRMRQLVLPIFQKYKAMNITTEADNFITVFPDIESAVSSALEMQKILLDYNASLSEERQHYRVRLNGIGVGFGKGVIIDNEGKLHGTPANDAYHIGEDVCEGGIILVTKPVVDLMKTDSSE